MSFESIHHSRAALEAAIAEAERKRSQGDIWGTYADYQAIATARMGGDYDAADLTILQSLADLAMLCGDVQQADDLWGGLVDLCRRAKNPHRADFAVLKRIHLALDRGQLRQAKTLFAEMAPRIGSLQEIDVTPEGLLAWERRCRWPNTDTADRTVLFTLLYLEMGRLLSALGQYGEALKMLNRGLTHATPGDSQSSPVLARQQIPWLQLAIAQACLESGLLPEAEAVLDALKPRLGSRQERMLQIQWHTLAGKLALLRGEFGKALEHFQEILSLCHQLKNQRGMAIASLNLAQVLIVLNQTQLAADHLLNIAADVEQSQDPHLQARLTLLQRLTQARSQSLVAGSTFSVSEFRQSSPPTPTTASPPTDAVDAEGSSDRLQSPNYLTFFEDRVLEFQWALSEADFPGANQRLAHIQAVFANTDSRLIHAKIQALHGMLAYYQGLEQLQAEVESGAQAAGLQRIQWAAVTLDQARSHLVSLGLKPDQWQVQRLLGWCLMRLQSPAPDQERLAADTTQLLAELTDSLDPDQQAIFLLNKWTADEEYIATQIVGLRRLQQRSQTAPLHQRLRLKWQLLQRLNALVTHIDRYRGILARRHLQDGDLAPDSAPPPSLWQRLLHPPWRRATLAFLVLPDQIFVVRNWRFWLDFAVVPLTRLELRRLVEQWYTPLASQRYSRGLSLQPEAPAAPAAGRPEADSNPAAIAQILVEKLQIPDLLRLPRYIHRLTIVPDDVLHIFPFAAIKHQDQYLVQSYALSIAYETMPAAPSPAMNSASEHQPLLVGVSQGGPAFAALPGVKQELGAIFTWLSQRRRTPQVFMDDAIHKSTLLSALTSASLLHIACHGIFQHRRADQSGLVLNPQTDPPTVLSLHEIAHLNLTALHHVTLSACSSADHLVLPGRWVISLPETLWRAGAHSILGNLWEVYDQLAIAFMARFYTYLQTRPRDVALRQTQLDCLHQCLVPGASIDTQDPKYWAGFSLYGTSGRWQV